MFKTQIDELNHATQQMETVGIVYQPTYSHASHFINEQSGLAYSNGMFLGNCECRHSIENYGEARLKIYVKDTLVQEFITIETT